MHKFCVFSNFFGKRQAEGKKIFLHQRQSAFSFVTFSPQ